MKFIDIHSHILPGMDDGSRSMRQSLDMLRIAEEEGITTMFATPHNMPGKGCPKPEVVYENVEALKRAAKDAGISIEIMPGTEYFYREEVLEILEEEAVITLGASDCVLVEFDPIAEKVYIRNALREVMAAGYHPVIAHVERYAKLMADKAFVKELKQMGVLVQINAASVTGDNGRHAKWDVKRLLKAQLVDFVGTDAHSDGRRAPRMEKCANILYKKYGAEYADALLFGNAEYYILENGKD
ncbi:MAG: hypothetical protein II994_02565 [Lachnospiraceae bacterium]|nr:hypothetical protein [Lachnospiraceae bacterium]